MTESGSTVLVTGAGGAVGSKLVPSLLERGHIVTSMIRSTYSQGSASGWGSASLLADVRFRNQYENHMGGIDNLIHLAAKMGGTDLDDFMEVNLFGTQQLAESYFKQNPTGRFIYVSSISAMGIFDEGDRIYKTESDYSSEIDNYGRSKRAAEMWLENYADEKNADIVILRPGVIYGPNMQCWLADLVEDIRHNRLGRLAHGAQAIPLVHIENLVEICLAILAFKKPPGLKTYICVDEGSPSLDDLITHIAGLYGVTIASRKWSVIEARLRGFVGGILAKRDGRATVITKSRIKLISTSQRFDGSLVRQELPGLSSLSWPEGVNQICSGN